VQISNEFRIVQMNSVLERVFTHGMDGVLVVHAGRDVLRANPAACAMLGRTELELQHASRDSVVVDTADFRTKLALRDGGISVRGEVDMRRANGSAFPAEFSSGLMPDVDDQLAYFIFRDVSDTQKLQRALQASDARHRDFFETVLEGICYVSAVRDVTGRATTCTIVEANSQMHRMLNRSDLRGLTSHDVVGAAAAEEQIRIYEQVRASGIPLEIEVVIGAQTLRNRVTRQSDDMLCVSCLDVTAQRRAERELRESVASAKAQAAELRAVLDAAPAAIWITRNVDGERIETNAYAADLQRLPRGSTIEHGNPASESLSHYVACRNGRPLPPSDVPIRLAARTGQPVHDAELDLVFDDGTVRHLIGDAVPLLAADGSPRGAVAAFLDITERKANEQALATALGRFDAFMTAMPVAAWAKNVQGELLYVNAEWQRTIGMTCTNALGHRIEDLVPALDDNHGRQEEETVLETGNTVVSVGRLRNAATGAMRWWQTARFIINGADGDRQLGGIAADITDQKEHEETLRVSEERARAAQTALEEALELTRSTEANFRQAQKMEAVGQLAGGIAHDFNNLLTVILGNSELLVEALPDHPFHSELKEIQDAGTRAATLTRQLLAFSRRQPLEPQVLDLNALLRGMERMFARVLGEQYDLAMMLASDLHRCFVDHGQVEQVVLNLVLNARDAMPDRGRISIDTRNVTLDQAFVDRHPTASLGPQIRLSVSDTGCGMSAETLAHIFEPFFTTKAAGKGTGLGLSTAYGIVKQSGGNIWVNSEVGIGTTVNVYLPSATGAEPATPDATTAVRDYSGHETILLSEDDALVRSTVAGMLRRAGYHVIEAQNGRDALTICELTTSDIALVVTDVVMPRMNGRELADRLHAVNPQLNVLFISGYSDNVIEHDGVVDLGINFLQKPLTAEMLLPKVREILNHRVAIF
jgi:PAS domain S-box-containing protein